MRRDVVRRRRTLVPALAIALPAGFAARDAAAQVDVDAQATMGATLAWTDNVLQAPDPDPDIPDEDEEPVEADTSIILAPGAALIFLTPSATHTIGYTFGLTLWFVHSEANAYTHTLTYGANVPLTETLTLGLGVGATIGQLSNFNRTNAPQEAVVDAQQPDNDLFLNVFANQSLTKEITPLLTGAQSTTFTTARTLGQEDAGGGGGETYIVSEVLTLARQFEYDIVGGEVGSDYSITSAIADDEGEEIEPAQHELTSRVAATWQHQFGQFIASNAALGVVHSMNVQELSGHLVHPYGLAGLTYAVDQATATLQYAHTAGPNVFLNQTVVADSITLAVGVPLGQLPLDVSAGAGFTSNRVIQDGELSSPQQVALVDAGLTYTPPQYPSLSVDGRYQFLRQLDPAEEDAEILPPGFTQNSVFLTVGITYPDFVAGGNEAMLASPFRPAPNANLDILQRPPERPPREEEEEDGEQGGGGQNSDE